jgi:hypothetical protein
LRNCNICSVMYIVYRIGHSLAPFEKFCDFYLKNVYPVELTLER